VNNFLSTSMEFGVKSQSIRLVGGKIEIPSMNLKYLCVFLAACHLSGYSSLAGSEFYFTSSPQSWIGQGETVDVTSAQGATFSLSQSFDTSGLHLMIGEANVGQWGLDFVAPGRVPLTPGEYDNAARWPFEATTQPGLSFVNWGEGRGDNALSGYFDVLSIQYSGGTVTSAAIDFVQYDETIKVGWNFGSLRYNSDLPITPVPEPETSVLAAAGLFLFLWRPVRRKIKDAGFREKVWTASTCRADLE
jgi:hypothetical protein